MQVFLNEVAKQLFKEFNTNFSNQVLVFPNRRSALYFKKYLGAYVNKPTLSPQILTINDLFQQWSSSQLADPLFLMFRLYKSYNGLRNVSESFDEFYYWGEMIINDFDDIDKYLVDHNLIFQNLKDLHDIDARFGGLEPEVIEIIRQFWASFDPSKLTPEKDDFLAVWDILGALYTRFKTELYENDMAYEGMLMRDIIDSLSESNNPVDSTECVFHFIGFNALNRCEKELMKHLKNKDKAFFYWDYDKLYTNEENHEAGFFIRENLKFFGQDLGGLMRYDNLISPEHVDGKYEVFKAPSDVAQAKLIPAMLEEFDGNGQDPDNTAIVLADENMLMPVINSIPESVKDINITMGYPIYQTPVYSLIHQLLSLIRNARFDKDDILSFYYADVMKLINHQYITFKNSEACDKIKNLIKENNLIRVGSTELHVNSFLKKVFTLPDDHSSYNQYMLEIIKEILAEFSDDSDVDSIGDYVLQQEYLYRVITSLNKLDSILKEPGVPIGLDIFIRIVDKILHKLIVPFTGEPLKGLQVMGILETRALDFKNIIIVSVNEGVLPRGSAGNSYIPYNLRMAFGLPTVKHQDSIYAYYFYRLIQRADKVRFVYNSNVSGMRTGEMSRFLLQLKYNLNFHTVFSDSRFNIVPPPLSGDWIKRDPIAQKRLEDAYINNEKPRALSPSALNTWISCRMRFYYRYIIGLKEQDNVKEEIDSPMFGTILHDAMNNLYSDLTGMEIRRKDIDLLQSDTKRIEKVVEDSFRLNYMRGGRGEISGKNLIITSVLRNMISRILYVDSKCTPFKMVELEKRHYNKMRITIDGKDRDIILGGIIDRVDELDSGIRILDYKSGKDSLDIDSLESLTSYNIKNRNSAGFQTFVYSKIYSGKVSNLRLRPSLYPVRSIYNDNFSDVFNIKKGDYKGEVLDFSTLEEDFTSDLNRVVLDIFDPERDFDMTSITDSCTYCPFSNLCGRYDLT
jgi:hypothetical protein